jgi:hypothetical protein
MALNNESFSTAGQYDGKPRKEHQVALKQFLASRRATAVYPASAWSGVVFLFPNADGTLLTTLTGVTLTGTNTLTNKSLQDLTTFIIDNVDATKKAQFECSGITTGTTRGV